MSWLVERFRKIDPRWFVLINNGILLLAGRQVLGLQRDPLQIAGCLVTGASVELLLARTTRKHTAARLGDRLLSSTVAGLSTLILLRSEYAWFYALAVAIAVVSKYLIIDGEGRHVFNPTAFAIVFLLSFFPGLIFVRPDQFPTFVPILTMIIAFGLLATTRARRWAVSLGYYAVVFGAGLPLGRLLGFKPVWILGPELNSSTLIFAAFLMTDPKTSPATPLQQLGFGGAIAAVHLYLRYQQIPFSPFIALFTVAVLRSLGRAAGPGRAKAAT